MLLHGERERERESERRKQPGVPDGQKFNFSHETVRHAAFLS